MRELRADPLAFDLLPRPDLTLANSTPFHNNQRGLIYFTQVYTAMELAAKLWPCFKYIIPNQSIMCWNSPFPNMIQNSLQAQTTI